MDIVPTLSVVLVLIELAVGVFIARKLLRGMFGKAWLPGEEAERRAYSPRRHTKIMEDWQAQALKEGRQHQTQQQMDESWQNFLEQERQDQQVQDMWDMQQKASDDTFQTIEKFHRDN